jgi:DNA/RNA endonuclease YhcR with UshA esterase domain
MAEAAKAPVATASRDPGAMDATDLNLIASRLGMKSVVIGVVKSVLTLGSTGHKKLLFEGSEFEVFLSKSVQEKEPAQDLEALKGQTVQITGTISQYQEKLQISLRSVSDLAVVSGTP